MSAATESPRRTRPQRYPALGDLLRSQRLSARPPYSQADLAKRAGISQSELGAIELGQRRALPPEIVNRLACVLDVPASALLLAMGYNITAAKATPFWLKDSGLRAVLETARPAERKAITALLRGLLAMRDEGG